jgi:hypothetical protein
MDSDCAAYDAFLKESIRVRKKFEQGEMLTPEETKFKKEAAAFWLETGIFYIQEREEENELR